MNCKSQILLISCFLLGWVGPIGAATIDTEFYPAGSFKVHAELDPETPKVGNNRIRLMLQDESGNTVSNATLTVVAVMPSMGSMPAMYAPAEMTETKSGLYEGEFSPSMAGEWPLTIKISTPSGSGSITYNLATGRRGLRCITCNNSGDSSGDNVPGTVKVNPARQQLIGITTGRVRQKTLRVTTRAAAIVKYDETQLRDITLKFDGWIGELYANAVGNPVTRGKPLFTVYSPELLAAQEEYLESLRHEGKASSSRAKATFRRLRLWDLTEGQIEELKQSGRALEYIPILAAHNGIVVKKTIVAGSAFHKGQQLLRTANLSKIWVEAQVYDYELQDLHIGMKAIVEAPEIQDRKYSGTIDYIFPFMDGDNRTTRVRIILENADGELRPDMYVQVRLRASLGKRLVVPESAVLYSGSKRYVFLDLGDGRFAPRRIKTGRRNRQWIEVLEGLQENDQIVTSGNFLIASESKLKAGLDQW